MQINSINFQNIYKFNNLTRRQNIFFKGNQTSIEDSFEKQNERTAFLKDPTLSEKEKEDRIKEDENLAFKRDISKQLGYPERLWYNDKCFVTVPFVKSGDPYRIVKKPIVHSIIDTSIPVNKKNIEILQKASENAIDLLDKNIPGYIDKKTFNRYVANGLLEETQLYKKDGKGTTGVPLIDLSNPVNQKGYERLKQLRTIETKYLKSQYGKNNPINVTALEKYGYGEARMIANMVNKKELAGKISLEGKKNGRNVYLVTVDLNNVNNRVLLEKMKQARCIGLHELAEKSGIDITKIEDCILNGEMDAIREKILPERNPDEISIDTKNSKNIETFDRLLFEKRVEEEFLRDKKEAKKQGNREISSIRSKIAWILAPNTRNIARQTFKAHPELNEKMKRKEELTSLLSKVDIDEFEAEIYAKELIAINKDIKTMTKQLYRAMWDKAGTEEYKNAMKSSVHIIKEYQTSRKIDTDNPQIRDLLINSNISKK